MNVDLNIERLVLEGLDLPRHQHPRLQAAVELELTRLLATNGLDPALLAGGRVPRLSGGTLQMGRDNDPTQLGQQIAQAVYGGIGS